MCDTSTGNKNTQDKVEDGLYPFYVRSQNVERINSWTFDGEAILTAGDGVGVGKVFHHTYGKIGVHQRVYILSDFKCDANYLFHYFASNFYNRVKRMSAKNSVDSVRKEMITEMPLYLPCQQEQTKIGKLLTLLDQRIATQSRVIEKLQSLIRGLMDNLLCNSSWNKVYLRDVLAFYPTNSLSWDKLTWENLTGIRNLHYGLIHNSNLRIVDVNTLPYILKGYVPAKYVLCKKGDVAFADASEDTNEIAKAIEFCNDNNIDIVCGLHTIHGRDIHGMTIDRFKGYVLNTKYFHKQIRRMAQGTKVFSVSANNISNCYIFLPDKAVQKKVVDLLESYSSKYQNENELLTYYTQQKQYLLRQMFI